MRAIPAYIIHSGSRKYLIFKNNAAGRRGRYDVLQLGYGQKVRVIGREVPLGFAKGLCT